MGLGSTGGVPHHNSGVVALTSDRLARLHTGTAVLGKGIGAVTASPIGSMAKSVIGMALGSTLVGTGGGG
jgi:hypothetical protein